MKRLKISAGITCGLGTISFVFFVLERMALQDIWHGESDPTLEWSMVFLSFPFILLFYVSVLVTCIFLFKSLKQGNKLHDR